jgi:hypothetical protein
LDWNLLGTKSSSTYCRENENLCLCEEVNPSSTGKKPVLACVTGIIKSEMLRWPLDVET